jgi:hypothetical protein
MKDIFGEDFYIEIMSHKYDEELKDKEELFNELYPINEDYDSDDQEEYNKMKQLIYEKTILKEINYIEDNQIILKKNNNQSIKKNSLNLNELNIKIDKLIEKNKPQKFVSKRCQQRKENIQKPTNIIKEIIKRQFNPKKIPYFKSDLYLCKKNKNNLILDDFNFPAIKK